MDTDEQHAVTRYRSGRHAAKIGGLVVGAVVLLAAVLALRVPSMGATVVDVSGRFSEKLPVSEPHTFLRMRAPVELDKAVKASKSPEAIWLRVLPDEEGASSYEATLSVISAGGRRVIGRADELAPDSDAYVSVFVRSKDLASGKYSLVVSPKISVAESPTDFRFEVSRE